MTFWTKFAKKKGISSQNGKSEHHHRILHIRISLRTKSQVKLTILIFWTKFAQRVFGVRNGKIALVRASMVVTYFIKLLHTATDKHNGILMSLRLLVSEKIIQMVIPDVCDLINIYNIILRL